MKTKITSKNKNVINIKINTEKKAKAKKRNRAKRSGSPNGRSSYNSGGYGAIPPIIIQPSPSMIFPQYNPGVGVLNNSSREAHSHINEIPHNLPVEQPQPQNIPIAQLVSQPIPSTPYINPSSTTPMPIAQSVPKKWKSTIVERNNDFINDTSTHPIPIAKAIDEEGDIFENFYTPHKKSHSSPNIDTLQNYYDNGDNDELSYTNPMSSVKELKKSEPEPEPEIIDLVEKNRHNRNALSLANYHSKADDFSIEKYHSLLEKYYSLNPNMKVDSEFEGKKPSRSLYAKLMGKVNKEERKKTSVNVSEPLDLVPVPIPKQRKKKIVVTE